MKTTSILSNLNQVRNKYESVIDNATIQLKPLVEFEFFIDYQPSDGFIIVDYEAKNAPLRACIEIINTKGRLSHEDYLDNRI